MEIKNVSLAFDNDWSRVRKSGLKKMLKNDWKVKGVGWSKNSTTTREERVIDGKSRCEKCQATHSLSLSLCLSLFARGTYESCDFTAAFSHRLNSIIKHEDPAVENDVPIVIALSRTISRTSSILLYINSSLPLSLIN